MGSAVCLLPWHTPCFGLGKPFVERPTRRSSLIASHPMQKNSLVLTLAVVPFLAASSQAAETVSAYLSAPYTQSAKDSGATSGAGYNNAVVETFDETGMMTGNFTTITTASPTATPPGIGGTFTSSSGTNSIDATGQYGGGGQGNYLGVNGTVTLTFSSPVMYLGLFWCAVDSGNSASFYDQNGVLLGTYNAATFSNLLPDNNTSTVTAINGTTYNTINYFGQPTGNATTDPVIGDRQNNSQQYAYLNFIPGGTAAGGAPTEIGKVVLKETGATFESDNYAVLSSSTRPPGFLRARRRRAGASYVGRNVRRRDPCWARCSAAGASGADATPPRAVPAPRPWPVPAGLSPGPASRRPARRWRP